ncbi:hypothetical protein FO519_008795 [Halicephalobus sp. NKZ332]|nr:hypothetical protein FO519_008795 [Halicephalobus sp. NKZ332]
MENQQQTTTLCRGGCGFYGSSATEGLCSKCFKDTIKRKQDTARLSPNSGSSTTVQTAETISEKLREAVKNVNGNAELVAQIEEQLCSTAASPTSSAVVETPEPCSVVESVSPVTASIEVAAIPTAKKSNRCLMCNKRVGLTGFTCRCGGLYCGEHRYDQAHDCTFDYKTMEREEIRRNNPMIVSDKIQRI